MIDLVGLGYLLCVIVIVGVLWLIFSADKPMSTGTGFE
jgi:heme/copper-type cytochrome/quinol oxidase subunit 4